MPSGPRERPTSTAPTTTQARMPETMTMQRMFGISMRCSSRLGGR
jgi:hypothetical protein